MDEIATLSFAGRRVRLDFGEPHLRPGVGAHRLSLSMRSQADWLDPEATPATVSLLVEGEIWWDQAMGPFATLPAKVLTLRGYPVSENWPLHLSDEQLIAIESRRGIGDLVFRLDLAGTFLHEAASIHPTQTTQIGYRIAVSDWLAGHARPDRCRGGHHRPGTESANGCLPAGRAPSVAHSGGPATTGGSPGPPRRTLPRLRP